MQTSGAGVLRNMNSSKNWVLLALVLSVNRNSALEIRNRDSSVFEQRGENSTNECTQRLSGLPSEKTEVARQALDAFGKSEAGLLVLNRQWLGHFSECTNLEDFKYCLLTIDVRSSETAVALNEKHYLIKWGVCVPRQCSREDLTNGIPAFIEISKYRLGGFDVDNVYEDMWCLEDPVIPYGFGFYITVVFFTFVGTLMIAGSIFDVLERKLHREDHQRDGSVEMTPLIEDQIDESLRDFSQSSDYGCKRLSRKLLSTTRLILLDFALNRNLKKLLRVGEGGERNIRCLHGIRVISLLWIILGHTYDFNPFRITLFNQLDVAEWKNNFFYQTIILNFYTAVDSFFFLSGLLVCFTTLRKLETANGSYPWHWFYLHRYIRLSPSMLVTIMINMFISPYFIKGPDSQMNVSNISTNNCVNYWWTNLIYINNIYPWNVWQTCLAWTWYLANDMQFFAVSPLIILSFRSFYWLGFGIVGTTLAICFVITGTLVAAFNFRFPKWELMKNGSEYVNLVYSKPYSHLPPYLVGMVLGYMLFKHKDRRMTISRGWLLVGWIFASAVAAALLCGTTTFISIFDHGTNTSHLRNKPFTADHHASALGTVVDVMFSRFAWGIFLCWVVIACQLGEKGWVNDILGWSLWEPLSRMNYNAYLIHPIVLHVFYGNFGQSLYVSRVLMTFYFCGTVLLSYISAMILTLAVEMPISNIERRFMPRLV